MVINKQEIIANLKADLKKAEILKKDIDAKIDSWSRQANGLPYGNEEAGKSAIVSKDIKKQTEWQIPSIIDPFVSAPQIVRCLPITYEDTLAARQNELVLNTQFCRQFDRYNFMNKAIRVLENEGTVVVQTGWDYEDEEIEVDGQGIEVDEYGMEHIVPTKVKELIVKKNKPTARICRNVDIYIDPTCQDNLDNAQFVIYRYESDLSSLKKDGRYTNLDKIQTGGGDNVLYRGDYISPDRTYFSFADKARKKLMVYEYWGNYDVDGDGIAEAIVCAWVGDTIIRLEENPYPDKKPPFLVVPFNSIPFQMHGESNAELIGDNQKVKTAIIRGIIDNMAQSNNGQIGVRKGILDVVNKKKFLQGRSFEYNGTREDFWQGSYNNIPASAFNMLELMNNEIESLTGVKSFSGGINGNSLGSSATGARGALDATSVRRMNIIRNISENLVKPLLRKWMSYNAAFLQPEEVIRITNEEFVPIKRDDLLGNVDIDITVASLEDNSAKSQELSFLLQTLGNSVPFEITQHLMGDMLELMRMPEQAKRIREFQPPKDEMQEQLKQLELQHRQLELAKLQSEIERNKAKSAEDQVDVILKQNKAELEAAKARLTNSTADLKDMDFLRADEGIDHQQKMAEFNAKQQATLDSKALDAYHRSLDNDRKHQSDLDKLMVQLAHQNKHKEVDHLSKLDIAAFEAMQRDKDRKHKNGSN